MTLKRNKDGDGNHWRIPSEYKDGSEGCVDIWWNRDKPVRKVRKGPLGNATPHTTRDECLVLRQVNDDDTADCIFLSPGQVYDLICVLNQAVEHP